MGCWRFALGLSLFLVLLLSGCTSLPPVDRFYKQPWCYPKAKIDRDRKAYYAGIACKF